MRKTRESKKTHDARNARLNPIRKICYKLCGGIKEYNKLSPEERSRVRAEATKIIEQEKGESSWINKVLPFIKRGSTKSKPMTTRETVKVDGRREPQGWVYAICNPDNPLVLKIGKTYTDGIEDRLSEARRWGRASLLGKWYFSDALQAETLIHQRLYNHNLRVLGFEDVGKELFKCLFYEVEQAVEEAHKELEPSVSEG